MKMTAAMITRPITITTTNVATPFCLRMFHRFVGKVAMIWVKIRIDMPLPTPRSVISSPSHMITPVPAVMVSTITMTVNQLSLRSSGNWQPWNRRPGVRASATNAVACRIASPTVRNRVYWVILVCPA